MRYFILVLGFVFLSLLPLKSAHAIGGRWQKNRQPQRQTAQPENQPAVPRIEPQHEAGESSVLSDRPVAESSQAAPQKEAAAAGTDLEEEVVANLILAKRLIKIPRSPLLDAAARERACVSAKEGTMSHFDKAQRGPNFYVKKNGFPFNGSDNGNQVESIAWGNTSGLSAWNSWMDSPHHRDHIMARGFSQSHTHFGVGHCIDSSGNHVWTVISAPMTK